MTTPAPPLLERLVRDFGATWVTLDTHDAFAAGPGDRVLLFSGDPVRFPEGQDVAAVLPELQRAHAGRFVVGVVPASCEEALARRYGAQRRPSLVFLREGRYVDTLAGMHDWVDYVALVGAALAKPPGRAPTVGIPLVSDAAAPSCH